jgi:hypothetical protein
MKGEELPFHAEHEGEEVGHRFFPPTGRVPPASPAARVAMCFLIVIPSVILLFFSTSCSG